MSSSSSRIARLRHAANKNYHGGVANVRRDSNKYKKSFGNLSAYGSRINTFYTQATTKHCCPVKEEVTQESFEDICGNIEIRISPATNEELKRNPEIRSILGITVPKYDMIGGEHPRFTPDKHFTLIHNLIFKTTHTDLRIIDYNREFVSLPPGQVGWDDNLLELYPGYRYYYAVLSGLHREIPINTFIPLLYLNKPESSNLTMLNQVRIRTNKTQNATSQDHFTNNHLQTTLRLIENTASGTDPYALKKMPLNSSNGILSC